MDEALLHDDARPLVLLHWLAVVVPSDLGAVVQVGGGALEGQPVALENHLAQRRDEVVGVQLWGARCGGHSRPGEPVPPPAAAAPAPAPAHRSGAGSPAHCAGGRRGGAGGRCMPSAPRSAPSGCEPRAAPSAGCSRTSGTRWRSPCKGRRHGAPAGPGHATIPETLRQGAPRVLKSRGTNSHDFQGGELVKDAGREAGENVPGHVPAEQERRRGGDRGPASRGNTSQAPCCARTPHHGT